MHENEAHYFRETARFLVKCVFDLINLLIYQFCLHITFGCFRKESPMLSRDESVRPIMILPTNETANRFLVQQPLNGAKARLDR